MISFKTTNEEFDLIVRIADRASAKTGIDYRTILMDLTACHANGTRLQLSELLTADEFNFSHDVCGIYSHIDRETGKLKDCFIPRFAASNG